MSRTDFSADSFLAKEKIRIVIEGLRGDESTASRNSLLQR